jgi:hypothetical protein
MLEPLSYTGWIVKALRGSGQREMRDEEQSGEEDVDDEKMVLGGGDADKL